MLHGNCIYTGPQVAGFHRQNGKRHSRLEECCKTRMKLEKFRVGGVLIIQGLECCAQEFGLYSVNSGGPAKASKLRNDIIRSVDSDCLWSNHHDPGIMLNIPQA